MPDILLIRPDVSTGNTSYPLGLGYLASALIRSGRSVCIEDCPKEGRPLADILAFIQKTRPKAIGITVYTNEVEWARDCINEIRKISDAKIIVGGPHPTGLKKDVFNDLEEIDFAVYSEGEVALPLLMEAISSDSLDAGSLCGIPNLLWRRGEDVVENRCHLTEDLDSIGFPAWNLIKPDSYPRRPHGGFARAYPFAPIITSRGCPYPCQFCAASLMQGNRMRRRSVGNIIEEIRLLIKDYSIREIHIEDDNFTFSKDFVIEFCETVIRSGINIFFSLPNGIRLDRIDQETLTVMKRANFYSFAVGIESGSQRILDRMGKKLNLGLISEKVSMIKKCGFTVKGFFMLGYPGETKEDMDLTIKFSKKLPLDLAFFSVFIPLPGTPEYARLVESGELKPHGVRWSEFYTGTLKSIPYSPVGLNKAELKRYISRALREFYLRPKIIYKLLLRLNSWDLIKLLILRVKGLILKI